MLESAPSFVDLRGSGSVNESPRFEGSTGGRRSAWNQSIVPDLREHQKTMNDDQAEYGEPEPIGWDAIDGALASVYGDREPKHYGTLLPASLGGNHPLQGISVYKNDSPAPHYHYVTYGFSELYEKETEDPEFSGYGFELTFRLACGADDDQTPPVWPLNLLQNLARYVFSTGNAFDERHHMTLNGPIAIGRETGITAILLTKDPQLPAMDTRNGRVKFLQIVGLCEDEYELVQAGCFDPIADRVSALTPLSITNIYRSSILDDEATREAIASSGPKTDQSEIFGTVAEWNESDGRLELRIGATLIPQLKGLLQARLVQGDPIAVYGKRTGIVFERGTENGWSVNDSLLVVSVNAETAASIGHSLQPVRGKYPCELFPAMTLHVVPIPIKDAEGNVVKTVG